MYSIDEVWPLGNHIRRFLKAGRTLRLVVGLGRSHRVPTAQDAGSNVHTKNISALQELGVHISWMRDRKMDVSISMDTLRLTGPCGEQANEYEGYGLSC